MAEIRPFKALVAARPEQASTTVPSDRLWTPATGITVSRPAIAEIAVTMLKNGKQPASVATGAALATDALDGFVARFISKHWPDSELGLSTKGAQADQYFDVITGLMLCAAIIKAPRMTLSGRLAASEIMIQETQKFKWAAQRAYTYWQLTGEVLDIPTADIGREAMIEKGVAIFTAVLSSDFDDPVKRQALGALSLSLARIGTDHGEQARVGYEEIYQERVQTILAAGD